MSVELSNAEQYISWLKTKAHLNSIVSNAAKRHVRRGQVYWCHFGINIGSEMSKTTPRPAIIVSNYSTNNRASNVIVVPVTHSQSTLPYLVPLTPIQDGNGNVILDGQADTANIICISKARLGDFIAALPAAQMKAIDKSIAISLELLQYYNAETEKYNKLSNYVAKVKQERNDAQDLLKQLQAVVAAHGFDEEGQKKIKQILDIQ